LGSMAGAEYAHWIAYYLMEREDERDGWNERR
jgi:hypothetical protein